MAFGVIGVYHQHRAVPKISIRVVLDTGDSNVQMMMTCALKSLNVKAVSFEHF